MASPKGRLVAGLAVVLVCAAPARAEKQGESIWNLGLGVGLPLSGLDLARFGGGSETVGGAGIALSPQYLRQLSSAFGLGAEFTCMDFPSASVRLPKGTSAGDLLGLEALGRYLFLPERVASPYVSVGLGAGLFSAIVNSAGTTVLDKASLGLTASPALGVKANAGAKAELSGELRWQLGAISRPQFGTGMYNILGFLLRVGWRS